ncbi:MAG TPA: cobalamin-binding protein [Oxalobacteraceae bacterium]|nr:cobalamin-binding protein [Oxalobacteraceae bacterium]
MPRPLRAAIKKQLGKRPAAACAAILLMLWPFAALAAVSAQDDAGHTITLPAPARRIISLAPHATELLYAAGAGDALVAVGKFSDYPVQATRLPLVGDSAALDLERIVALKPDLVVVWGSGNSAPQIARLRSLGLSIFESEPRDFATVASSLERLAHLAGSDAVGAAAAANFRVRLQRIAHTYRQRAPVRVFYQIWREPLMTLNDQHMVSAAIRLCGGENIFGKLPRLAPTVGIEDVLEADPEVIIAGSSTRDDSLDAWRRFPRLTAVARNNLFLLDSDIMTRAGPRVLDGTDALCQLLDAARRKRK